MRRKVALLASWFALLVAVAAFPVAQLAAAEPQQPRAAADPPQERFVDAFSYADDHAAQSSWQAMWGTAPVSITRMQGQRALKLTCNFAGTRIERAAWDRQVQRLDLTRCQAIRFQFLCEDPTPVSGFTIYFQSGDGWYAAPFSPAQVGAWGSVTIGKEDTTIEGTPAGWGQIRAIRISAWRGADRDTAFYLRDMQMVGGDSSGITIVRCEPAADRGAGRDELQSVATHTKAVATALAECGLDYSVISDRDLVSTWRPLGGRRPSDRLLVLPHNPVMSDAAADAIAAYLRGGGKLLAFYNLGPRIAEAAGLQGGGYVAQRQPGHFASIRFSGAAALNGAPPQVMQRSWNILEFSPLPGRGRVAAWWHDEAGDKTEYPAVVLTDRCAYLSHVLLPDDATNKRQLLLAMAGYLVPDLWQQAARRSIDRIGGFASYQGFEQAQAELSTHPRAAEALASAQQARDEASRLLEGNEPVKAIVAANRATRDLVQAYCLAQEPQPGEHRAFWCHSAFGVAGMDWDQSLKLLADNGFTAIIPNMLWGGVAYYDSKVLPVAAEVATRGDQIAQCLAAARKHGLQVHVWKVNWNMGWNAPKDFLQRMKQQGRTQVSFDGAADDQWLCPSHPDNQQLEIDAMVEVATNYDVDGIHFDYIRYPGPDGCFCAGCRQRFERAIGRSVAKWPQDVRTDERLKQRWLDFRRDHITRVVATVADKVHATRPGVMVSAAVFPNWVVDRDSVGQDWKLWCERGYLDFVCPMDYTSGNTEFAGMVQRQLEWAGQVPCYPGIGLSTWPGASRDIVKLIEQIQIARKLGAKGFTIFEYNTAEAEQVVPLCGLGITRRQP